MKTLEYLAWLNQPGDLKIDRPHLLEAKRNEAWTPHFEQWETLSRAQQVIIVRLIGTANERKRIAPLLEQRPYDATWQQLIDAVFDDQMRIAPTMQMDKRNHRDKSSISRSIS